MIIRKISDVTPVEWGNGLSHRFLVERDGMGYSLTDTIVWAGTSSPCSTASIWRRATASAGGAQ
ncbi:hypothetical protein ACNF49_18090 [Actinomadura sp. ATCC 39365]